MTEQSPGPLPPPPLEPPERRSGRRHTVLAVVFSVLGVLLVTVVVAGFLIHVPYVVISPGSATPLDSSVVQIDGATTYPHGGDVLFLTVQVSTHDPTAWRVVTSWLDPNRDVEKRSAVVGCLTDAQNAAFNTELMDQSQNDAKYVALTRLGYTVPANPVQIRIIEVCRHAPAYGALEPGDQVLAVDGTDVTDVSEVGTLVQRHRPGDRVSITFERDGAPAHRARHRGQGLSRRPCVPRRPRFDLGAHLSRRDLTGVRDLPVPGRHQDRHPTGRRAFGRTRLHVGHHRRHDAR